jgi:hypothetical protein
LTAESPQTRVHARNQCEGDYRDTHGRNRMGRKPKDLNPSPGLDHD